MRKRLTRTLAWLIILLMVAPPWVLAQDAGGPQQVSQEELDQLLAPIALYPDSLLAQIFIASTYPLEVVQADRWAKANGNLKGDALTAALEKQNWDPSVKSLANFPQVLAMMSERLDWTEKLGDAFLASEKPVMDTVQKLRLKAQEAGNLKTTEQQKVIVEKETKIIIIEPATPQVVYVPTYNPTAIYGPWWYPAYPPYYYYPPGYVAGAALFSFGVGVAAGAAWGYAWGNCNWRGGDVNININQNTNINNNINRNNYVKNTNISGGQGKWQHDPSHRKGVAYRDPATRQQYGKGNKGAENRGDYRGYGQAGAATRDVSPGKPGANQPTAKQPGAGAGQPGAGASKPGTGAKQPGAGTKQPGAGVSQPIAGGSKPGTGASQPGAGATKPGTRETAGGGAQRSQQPRDDAFQGAGKSKQTQDYSNRGSASRGSTSSSKSGGGGAQVGTIPVKK